MDLFSQTNQSLITGSKKNESDSLLYFEAIWCLKQPLSDRKIYLNIVQGKRGSVGRKMLEHAIMLEFNNRKGVKNEV